MTTAFSRLLLPSKTCLRISSLHELSSDFSNQITVIAEIYDRQAEASLYQLSQQLGKRLLVPEVWQQLLPDAGILISSQVSGGTLAQRLEEAQSNLPGRCWLRLEPFAQCLPLPCPSGCGKEVSADSLNNSLSAKTVFYSSDLCCSYLYDFPNGVILFRRKEEAEKLSELARQAGFCGTVEGPW